LVVDTELENQGLATVEQVVLAAEVVATQVVQDLTRLVKVMLVLLQMLIQQVLVVVEVEQVVLHQKEMVG
jgi:CRISPR/Cas system endoribonuclease Cas6 (RAMP superfamily)